jgi:shikimate dehydrogenase
MKAALIGKGIAASLTPALHEAAGAALGIPYSYDRYDLATPEHAGWSLAKAVDAAQAAGCRGVNVTYPFKQDVMALLDEISPQAREIGAVNTVVFEGERRIGHNTDYLGFRAAFERDIKGSPRETALLLGAGGAGGAVGLALIDLGAKTLWIHDKSQVAAQKLADRLANLRPHACCAVWTSQGEVDGIINATPMGMASHPGQAILLDDVMTRHFVGDIVYFPLQTALLRDAATRGFHVMTGGGMAVGQAAEAFKLFTGKTPDHARMTQHFHAITHEVSP